MTLAGTPASASLAIASIAALRRGGARLHPPRQATIERCHRKRDFRETSLGQRSQNVDVAQDQRRLRHDPDRMTGAVHDFENAPRELIGLLDGLVGIGICPERYGLYAIAGPRQLLFEKLRRVGFGDEHALEFQTGRKPEIAVRRPRKAIDAAMLAAAIGIDRLVEADIGRVVRGDDLPGLLQPHLRLERRQFGEALPAIVEILAKLRLETPGQVGSCAASAPSFLVGGRLIRRWGARLGKWAYEPCRIIAKA